MGKVCKIHIVDKNQVDKMDFKSKNFKYDTIKMDELIERVFEKTPSNYLLLKTKVSKISDAIYLAFISSYFILFGDYLYPINTFNLIGGYSFVNLLLTAYFSKV